MKKRLIFVGALLLAGTVTTSLCMKNAAATTDLLAANRRISWLGRFRIV